MDVLICGTPENDRGRMQLVLETKGADAIISAENHDGDIWEYKVNKYELLIRLMEDVKMDFSKFDEMVDPNKLKEDVAEAAKNGGGFPEIPKGTYMVKLESMEVGETGPNSSGGAGRPMLKAQFRVLEGEHAKSCLFLNRVLYGTKNDANMIASAIGFLESLEPTEDVGDIVFDSYSDFADLVMEVAEDVAALEYEVEYDPKAFNPISIKEAFETN